MLVLTRKPGEKVVLDNNIVVTVIKVEGNQVRLGFAAPDQVRIVRAELLETARREAPEGRHKRCRPVGQTRGMAGSGRQPGDSPLRAGGHR